MRLGMITIAAHYHPLLQSTSDHYRLLTHHYPVLTTPSRYHPGLERCLAEHWPPPAATTKEWTGAERSTIHHQLLPPRSGIVPSTPTTSYYHQEWQGALQSSTHHQLLPPRTRGCACVDGSQDGCWSSGGFRYGVSLLSELARRWF